MRLGFLGFALVACVDDGAGSDTSQAPVDSGGTSTEEPAACGEAVAVGTGGGAVEAPGARLEVPSGALAAEVELVLCPVADPPGAFEIGPEGTTFAIGATIALEGVPDGTELFVPGPDGQPVRSLRSSRPFAGALEGPVYRSGIAYPAADERSVVPYEAQGGKIDVLFVVDDSGSMQDDQAKLVEEFQIALPALLGTDLDFHAGVVTTDLDSPRRSGKLVEVDGRRWIDPTTPDPEAIFAEMAQPGITGSANEAGIGAAWLALDELADTFNQGFQREDADLAIVVVSDEEDQTPDRVIALPDFLAWLPGMRTAPATVVLHAIVNPPGTPPIQGDPGLRYLEAADATGGVKVGIHAESWSEVFERLAASPPRGFELPLGAASVEAWWIPADAEQTLLPSTFDPAENRVWVEAGDAPVDEIVILVVPG